MLWTIEKKIYYVWKLCAGCFGKCTKSNIKLSILLNTGKHLNDVFDYAYELENEEDNEGPVHDENATTQKEKDKQVIMMQILNDE